MKKKTIRLISLTLAVVMAISTIVYVSADEQGGFLAGLFSSENDDETALSDSALETEVIEQEETKDLNSGESENTLVEENIVSSSALETAETITTVDLAESAEVSASGSCGSNAVYTFYSDGSMIISGEGTVTASNWYLKFNITSLTIESGITKINDSVFAHCSSLVSAEIGDTVETIGDYAFWDCGALTSISLPDSLTSIGENAFSHCSLLPSIELPDSVTSIGDDVFLGCSNLTKVKLPTSITSITGSMFYNCTSLSSIDIPDSVTNIEYSAFYGCTSLSGIDIPNSVTSIGNRAFYGCTSLESITIPVYAGNIGENVFADSGLKTVYVYKNSYADDTSLYPEGTELSYLGDSSDIVLLSGSCGDEAEYVLYADLKLVISGTGEMNNFNYYSENEPWYDYIGGIQSVTIENGITGIGTDAFYRCTSLQEVIISESVTSIGSEAFYYCTSLQKVTIPCSILSIGSKAFKYSGLTTVYCYENSMADDASLYTDRVELVYIGNASEIVFLSGSCGDEVAYTLYYDGALTISGTGTMADFENSSYAPWYDYSSIIKSVYIENGVTSIGDYAFYDCAILESARIPDSVTSIGDYGFCACFKLPSITLPDSIDTIGKRAFFRCSVLKDINIPASLTSISEYMFYLCYELESITIPETITSIETYAFYGTGLTSVTIPGSVTSIGTYAFYYCDYLKEVTILESETSTSIGSYAFKECSSLENITMPDTVTSIGAGVFSDCTSLTEITIPDGITDLYSYTFSGCSSLTKIKFPDSLTNLWNGNFSGCSSLSEITLPANIGSIQNDLFNGCSSLKSITIPDYTPAGSGYAIYISIGERAFKNCTSLTDVIFPNSGLGYIYDYAFSGCTALTNIIIPETVKGISEYAFYGCSSIESFYVPEGAVVSDSSAIEGFAEGATVYCYSNTAVYSFAEELGYNIFVLDEHEHTFENFATSYSCTVQGYSGTRCTVCGYTVIDEYYGGEGHQFGDWVVESEATVFCDGYKYRECSVCDYKEEVYTDKIEVDIESNENYGLANFTVVDAGTLEPISGASMFITTENDGEGTVYTDSDGKISVILPVGKQTVAVSAEGYSSRSLSVTIVAGEQDIANIGLGTSYLVEGVLTAEVMTDEEIEEAGIDVDADDNSQIYKYEVTFEFGVYEAYFSTNGTNYSTPKKFYIDNSEVPITVSAVSENFYLIITGEVKWLKEMFDVQLLVINNSNTDIIENCSAELVLPDGLSLADMTDSEQTLTQTIDRIEEGGTDTFHWYVRGDTEGEYNLTANLSGQLMPFEEEFSYEYTTTEPLKVYAGSALHMTIKAPGTTYYGDDYPVLIELENVSDRTIYNLSNTINSLEQYKLTTYSDGTVEKEVYVDTAESGSGDLASASVDEFKPGDKLVLEVTSNIMFESDVINGKAAEILAAVGEAQKVLDAYNCSTAGSEILKDAYSVIEETASSINFVVNDDDVAEDSKKEAYSELAVAVGQLLRIIKTGSSSSLEVIKRLEKTGVYDDFYEISQDTSYYSTHTEEGINSILKVANTIINGCSEAEFETYSVFNILKSIAESMPVSFILEDVFVTTLEGSTTEIPYTVEITEGDSPVSYNVEAVGSYLYSLLCSAMGSDVPRFADVFSGSTEYSDYDDVIQHVKAVQNGTTTIAVEAASGDITFRAWVESALTTADLDDSVSVSSDFTLSSDNETAYIDDDGVLNFTGAGFINVTSSVETSGILYVEMTKGDETDVTAYVIDVVEEHTCSSDEWVTVVEPTEDSEGYMVKVCDVCGDVIDIKTTTLCENHSFGSYVVEVEPTEDEYGLKVKTCETCGYKQYSVIGISDTLELTDDSAYTIDESSGYVSGISDKTSIADFIANFDNDSEDIVILNTNGTEVDVTSTAYIGTGYIIQNIYNGEISDQLTVVIVGDINGDGEKDVLDLAKIFDHIQEVSALEGAYLQAAYINSDDEIDVLDLAELFDEIQS